MFRAALGMSSAVVQVDAQQHYTLFVGVTDVGPGAKTTMGMIAAEALGVPLSQVTVVSGDTERCPYSVGESGSHHDHDRYGRRRSGERLATADCGARDADGQRRPRRLGDPHTGA